MKFSYVLLIVLILGLYVFGGFNRIELNVMSARIEQVQMMLAKQDSIVLYNKFRLDSMQLERHLDSLKH